MNVRIKYNSKNAGKLKLLPAFFNTIYDTSLMSLTIRISAT